MEQILIPQEIGSLISFANFVLQKYFQKIADDSMYEELI